LLDPDRYRSESSSCGISCPFRVFGQPKYRPYCFCDPALPLAPLPRLCGFPLTDCRRLPFKLPTASSRRAAPSSRVLPSNTYPTVATAESSHGLSLPSAHQESEVHSSRAKPARYVPPSGFDCPLDGFLPRIPCRFCFTPAALLGLTLRRFPLPRGFRGFSVRKNPHTVSPAFIPTPKRQTGPTGLGFWVRASRDCLATPRRFRPRITGVSLGFCPCRVFSRRPWSDFSDTPLTCLAGPVDSSAVRLAPQSFNRPSTTPRPNNTGVSTGRDNPLGVLAPARS